MKKIDKVVLTNFKKHEHYIGQFNGKHFIVFGLNGAGKSSVIDAIKRTFGQKAKIGEPIRTGANGATITTYVTNDDETYILEEKFVKSSGKSRLRFYQVNGESKDELTPATERFYQIFGNPVDFTPLIDMDGDKQFAFLKENLGFDLSEYESKYDAIYDDRLVLGREISNLKGKIDAPGITEEDLKTYTEEKTPDELLANKSDIEPLLKERQGAEQRAANIKIVNEREAANEAKIEQLEAELKALKDKKKEFAKWYKENPAIDFEPIDQLIEEAKQKNEVIDQEILSIGRHNEMYRKVQSYQCSKKELEVSEADYKTKSEQLADLETQMRNVLLELPLSTLVPGMELVNTTTIEKNDRGRDVKVSKKGLLLEGLPFNRSQHSYGKLLKSIIKMAAHFNADKLNFIPIGDWSLLDEVSQQEVLDFANEHPELNIQFGIEKVDNNKEIQTEVIEFK